jgi:peptidyl-prolyl cis-trans isomerase D
MLQDIRQNVVKGPVARVVIWLIVISFAAFGIESILLGGGGSSVAEVNGEEISPQELQQALNTQKRRLIAMMGDQLDPAMLEDQRLSSQALQSLIGRKLLTQAADEMGLAISEQQISSVITGMEDFQQDGQFSPELYKALLAESGYTPGYFKQSMKEDMALNQLRSGLAGSEFATPYELELNARITAEQRDVRYLTIPIENFRQDSEISDAEISGYYEENGARFLSEESVDLDYIELSVDHFRQPVDEQLILEAYELEKQEYQYQSEYRVSHILFEAGEEQQQRLQEARARLAEGAPFADVAGELSDDIGSAAAGGDLGYTSGDAFPEAMEQAIAQLEPGVVSEPVETDAGIHLIVVTDRREGKPPELEDVRQRLHDDIQASEARVVLLRTVEELKDLSFNADNLDQPAGELDLTVARAEGVTRSQNEGLFAAPSMLSAVFSEDVLQAGHNSEVIELGDNRFVVLRVRSHHEPQVRPLEAVREEIVASITETSARTAVAEEAKRALGQLQAGTGVEQFAVENDYQWQVELGAERGNNAMPPQVLQRAFELPAPTEGENLSDFVMTATGDALVFELVRVTRGEYSALPEPRRQTLRGQVGAEYSSLVDTEFQQGLRDAADITVL